MEERNLRQLLSQVPFQSEISGDIQSIAISGIALDSRTVQPGNLFFALTGGSVDGHRFIPDAVKRGAAAVVGTLPYESQWNVPYLQVADARAALAWLSAAFYDFPGRKLTVVGITGTDGKTTTTNMLYQILRAAGLRVGMISTVNAVIGDEELDTGFHVTTPEAPDVQRYLARMVEAGLTHAVVEATSHGLAQERVTGVEFDLGVVTNITHEHLDYHGSYEAYFAAKARLFDFLKETAPKAQGNPRLAVLNRDDRSFEFLNERVEVRKVSYSLSKDSADVWVEDIRFRPDGTDFVVVSEKGGFPVHCNILGGFNVSNCLAAISAAWVGLGISPEAVQQGIAALRGVPGRMEALQLGQPFSAIVDFAHTPNALKRALETARQHTQGRVISVFGSAGLRDRQKRRMMAEVSSQLADITILTAEDPRTESLDAILEEMAGAAREQGGVEGQTFYRVPDRGEAIRLGVRLAQPGDLLIACGKGHEQSMCFGSTEYAWDDRTAMRAALAELTGQPGPQMPYLPTRPD